MKHSITYQAQYEKRITIPLRQALIVTGFTAGATLAITGNVQTAAAVSLSAGGLMFFVGCAFPGGLPTKQPARQVQSARAMTSEVQWYGATVDGRKVGVSMGFRYPVDNPDRWKIFCYKARVMPLSPKSLWTTDKGNNPKPMLTKGEYDDIIVKFIGWNLARPVHLGKNSPKELTDLGREYCKHVISHTKFLAPAEWLFLVQPARPTPIGSAETNRTEIRGTRSLAHVLTGQVPMGQGL